MAQTSGNLDPDATPDGGGPTVGLFVTCLVDLFRPSVGWASVKLLEAAGCTVVVPQSQTCCGQPAYNSGAREDAIGIAKQVIRAFESFDYIVAPSGSCAGMLKKHYPEMLESDPDWSGPARAVAGKVWELTAFLADVLGIGAVSGKYEGIVAYHDSCSSLREMGVREQPRALLSGIEGLAVREVPGRDVCCGFGGTFCVKYPEISTRMAGDKTREVVESGADTLAAGDMGCLLNLAGKLTRDGDAIKVYHVAELLAGVEAAPIGQAGPKGGRR